MAKGLTVPGRAAADGRHRARRLDEAGIADVVLELLAQDSPANDPLELAIARAITQRLAQIGLEQREQTRAQMAVGGQPDPVAVRAEWLRDGIDEAELPPPIGEAGDPGRGMRLARL